MNITEASLCWEMKEQERTKGKKWETVIAKRYNRMELEETQDSSVSDTLVESVNIGL